MHKKTTWTFFILISDISSLSYYFFELHTLLATSGIKLDVIGITESRQKRSKSHLTNTSLSNYNTEHCPTDSPNGGALLYIKEDIIKKEMV